MTFKDAKGLHNGDEVISKATGESIRVLNILVSEFGIRPSVTIEGVGVQGGYDHWHHRDVR